MSLYDCTTKVWRRMPKLPRACYSCMGAALQGKVYNQGLRCTDDLYFGGYDIRLFDCVRPENKVSRGAHVGPISLRVWGSLVSTRGQYSSKSS